VGAGVVVVVVDKVDVLMFVKPTTLTFILFKEDACCSFTGEKKIDWRGSGDTSNISFDLKSRSFMKEKRMNTHVREGAAWGFHHIYSA